MIHRRLGLALVLCVGATWARAEDPLLQVVGEPHFGGDITIHLLAPDQVGQPAALAYGLDPLRIPVPTGKGSYYIGSLFKILQLGTVPPSGRIDLSLTLPPPTPGVEGLPVILQGFAPPRLSNPAEVRFDTPYLLASEATFLLPPSPAPGAAFGERIATGDFDGDGFVDIAAGAAFETYQGFFTAGSVYVLWGPDWSTSTTIRPPMPGPFAGFGGALAAADFDGDGPDDLVITQANPDPFPETGFGHVYLASGQSGRTLQPVLVATSPTGGVDGARFGRWAAAGDVTGDGVPDAVIGAHGTSQGVTEASGAIMILPGPDLNVPWVIHNPTPNGTDFFGTVVKVADVDGDQNLDIIEASERANWFDSQTQQLLINTGELHVGYGPDFTTWNALRDPSGPVALERFGLRIAAADIDGDGFAEIATTSEQKEGFVFDLVTGETTVIPKPPDLFDTPFGGVSFGYALEMADVNADGLVDILIGDPFDGVQEPCSTTAGGVVWVALGPHYSTFLTMLPPTGECGDTYGWTMKLADIDGDGHDEVLTSVRNADQPGLGNTGAITIHQISESK